MIVKHKAYWTPSHVSNAPDAQREQSSVSRNVSHTSLLPSVQKLWQFAWLFHARCRRDSCAAPPVGRKERKDCFSKDTEALTEAQMPITSSKLQFDMMSSRSLSIFLSQVISCRWGREHQHQPWFGVQSRNGGESECFPTELKDISGDNSKKLI